MCFWKMNPECSESQRGMSLPWILHLTEKPCNSWQERAHSNGVQTPLTNECRKGRSQGPSSYFPFFLCVNVHILQDGNKSPQLLYQLSVISLELEAFERQVFINFFSLCHNHDF